MGVPIVIGGDNLPCPVGIGLTDLTKIRGVSGTSGTPSSTVPARDFKLRENLPDRLKVCFYIKVLP